MLNHDIRCFTEGDIGRITSNYRTIIGKGSFGEVYRGVLEDGSTVAVKRFVRNVEEDFAKELTVHSKITHENVVRLIGYCTEENALIIITEYMSKGNLSDVLHQDCIPIMLDTRLRIAVECSEALCYMHSQMYTQMYTQVIHGDIKPANILLDDNFNAKISDFGISRLINTDATLFTEHVIGSIGYMDPLFARYGRLTSKSDVYSFGVVLLELITKKKATVRKGEIGIVECFTQAHAAGMRKVRELFDVEISSQNNMKILEGVAKLVGECLMMEMDRRPEMIDVAERLRALRKTQVQGKKVPTIFPWGWRKLKCRQFLLAELESATGNFDNSHLVGVGRSGKVFHGVIDGGATKVAIKPCSDVQDGGTTNGRIKPRAKSKKFQAEIEMTAELCHDHLVSLIGYCKKNDEMILIYDYMAGGTLRGRLYGNNTEEPPLTWRQRLDVCIGAARALHYLHECSRIHRYLTTTNILLDERLVAKVSLPRVPSLPQHTMSTSSMKRGGYLDNYAEPEISDVYSFGVVLFEVLCAQAVRDLTLPRDQVHFVKYALDCKKKGILDRIVDPSLQGKIAPQCFNKFVETAEKCVAFNSADRPSMAEVVQNLEMCLAEESGSLGDDTPDDGGTNHPSTRELPKLEPFCSDESDYGTERCITDDDDCNRPSAGELSEESESYSIEIWVSDDDEQVAGSTDSE